MMVDKIETMRGSVIQHGEHNDRIYLMHLQSEDAGDLIDDLDRLAAEKGYGKIFAKIPATHWHSFKDAGYVEEALIPGFFRGTTDGLFVGKFFHPERQSAHHSEALNLPVGVSTDKAPVEDHMASITACTPVDADELSMLYRKTFSSYPFPIHQPTFLKRMMADNTAYLCIRCNAEIIAAAAAEFEPDSQTCEMTDFATKTSHQGEGLAGKLLFQLEATARKKNVKTAYTIARVDSYGMNWVFEKCGYRYAGRLVNNSQIGGRIRSMVVWYKHLFDAHT
jgi:putative beta-lysine N-acetyltransferase